MTETGTEMPQYRSHKKVWALKIKSVVNAPPDAPLGSSALEVVEPGYAPVTVSAEYMAKHQPKPGGYFVVYEDGYQSFSPAQAFEAGNTRINAEWKPLPTYREIRSHVVNIANDKIQIRVTDKPGAGGANHRYEITGFDASSNPSHGPDEGTTKKVILFQNGPIAEAGVNGVTQEVLIAVCIDRLQCFQRGPYACDENARALAHLLSAQSVLQERTRARMNRGVEGTHKV